MSHLVSIIINGELNRISTEDLSLDHPWDGDVINLTPSSYSLEHATGGYAKPRFGSVEVSKNRFTGSNWPPPASCQVTHQMTDDSEANAITVFDGNAHCAKPTEAGVLYNTYGGEYDTTINGVAFNAPIQTIFTTYCALAYLNLDLDVSGTARNPTIVRGAGTSDELLINVLSRMAAAVNHFFYIAGGTLYLCDMMADNGSMSLDEFDFRPITVTYAMPVSLFRSGDYTAAGSYSYGGETSLNTKDFVAAGNVTAHLGDSKTILERPTIRMELGAEAGYIPVMGQKIYFTDERIGPEDTATSIWFRVSSINFTQNGDKLVLSGRGELA